MPASDPSAYVSSALERLSKRPQYEGYGPTNAAIRCVIERLSNQQTIVGFLCKMKADLLEVAWPVAYALNRRALILATQKSRNTKRDTAKQAKKRARRVFRQQGDVQGLIQAMAHPDAWEARRIGEALVRLGGGQPQYRSGKLVTGRRPDRPAQVAHAELYKYFTRRHQLSAEERNDLIFSILQQFGLFYARQPADAIKADDAVAETYKTQLRRLRKQFPALKSGSLRTPRKSS